MSFNWFGKKSTISAIATNNTISAITITNSGSSYAPSMPPITITNCVLNGYSSSGSFGGAGGSGGSSWNGNNTFGNGTFLGSSYPTAYSMHTDPNLAIFVISSSDGKEVFSISGDGEVKITDSPSKITKALQNSMSFNFDKKAIGEKALAKIYKKAIERCLRQIKRMDKDEFIAMLETEIETRTAKEMLMYLKESPEGDNNV